MQMPCGHVFCQFCLSDWKKECSNKPFVCPNCRHKVQRDKVVPNIYLENLIQSWTKALGPETLKERERVLEERKGEIKLNQVLTLVLLKYISFRLAAHVL